MESYEYEGFAPSDVKEALILAGIEEIEEYGPAGFSLRRVASKCGVSCAAPYKHFKSKEALLSAIVSYIGEKQALLEEHILEVFPLHDEECLIELCLASVRFWIGNPHFRAVRMNCGVAEGRSLASVGNAAEALLEKLSSACSEEERALRLYAVRSLVTGAALMLEDGTLPNTPSSFRLVRQALSQVLFHS